MEQVCCIRLVVNKLSQAMRTHADINLLTTSCRKMSTDVWQNALFLLCNYSNDNNSNNYNKKNRCNNLNIIANSNKIMCIEILKFFILLKVLLFLSQARSEIWSSSRRQLLPVQFLRRQTNFGRFL